MRSGMRLVAMWVGLIALFVAFYAFFRQPGEPLPDLSGYVPVLLVVTLAVVVGVVIGKRNQKGWQLNEEGNTLLSRGRIAAALEKFEAARPLLRNQGQGAIPFNIGVCHLQLWQLDAAERDFTSAQQIQALPGLARKLIRERRYEDPITVFGETSTDKLRESWPALAHFLVERARQAT